MTGTNNQLQSVTSAVPTGTFSPTASSLAGWDTNSNLSANSMISGYATTATAAGTTTLTVASKQQQYFTGSTTQTVVLPVTSTLVLGQEFIIVNKSSGLVTVQSSGANTIQILDSGSYMVATVILTSGTTAASWSYHYDYLTFAKTGALQYFSTSGGSTIPGWLKCDGSIVSQSTYPALFSQVGLIDPPNSIFTVQSPPLTQGSAINQIAYSGSVYVAVGLLEGVCWIQRSTNATTWTVQYAATKTSIAFTGIAYGGGIFVAGKGTGGVETSTDGITWTAQTSGTTTFINQVSYGNGLFLLSLSPGNRVVTSTDGITWAAFVSPKANVATIAYGNGIYLGGSTLGALISSTNGSVWSTKSPDTSLGVTMTFGGGLYLTCNPTVGIINTSTNAITWTAQSTGSTSAFNSISYDGTGIYFAGGAGGAMYTSTNGITWVSRTSGTASSISATVFGTATYVYGGTGGVLRTSTDAITWTSRTSGTTSVINSLLWNGTNLFVYVTSAGGLSTSTDAITWSARTSGTASTISNIVYSASQALYLYSATNGAIGTSTDAITWTTTTANNNIATLVRCLAYGNGIYVVGGDNGFIASSTNGTTWLMQASATVTVINALVYDGSSFYAGSTAGWLFTSTNGTNWSYMKDAGPFNGTTNVSFANGLFFATAQNGYMATSTDNVAWTVQTLSFFAPLYNITTVAYGSGFYAASLNPTSTLSPGNLVALSTDAINWYPAQTNLQTYALQSNALIPAGSMIYGDRFMFPCGALTGPGYGNIVSSSPTYSYTSTTQFALPKDSATGITLNSVPAYNRSLYIKT